MEGRKPGKSDTDRARTYARENTGYMRDYVLNENGDIKSCIFTDY